MHKRIVKILGIVLILVFISGLLAHEKISRDYRATLSNTIVDRHGETITIEPNDKGYYVIKAKNVDAQIKDLLLKKEDRFFSIHFGINPVSMLRAGLSKLGVGHRDGSSTLTQQLAKLVLRSETKRTVYNKLKESVAAVSVEMFESKDRILTEYSNSVYLGNQIQGIETASRAYFGLPSDKLSTEEILQILVTLNNPSFNNPLLPSNTGRARSLAKQLGIQIDESHLIDSATVGKNLTSFLAFDRSFDISPWLTEDIKKRGRVPLTVDMALTDRIRKAVTSLMPGLYARGAHAAAVVITDARSGEVLAVIGSPDPRSEEFGQQINMAFKPRQIASTVKPFVYGKAFEAGIRPYTLIDDKEYGYTTQDGRLLYPRNFDGKYHGQVNADYALANSINVPAIKTLEYVGQDEFKKFMTLVGYPRPAELNEHQLGTALGTIDMTLVDLVHLYSIFPNEGELVPLKIFDEADLNAHIDPTKEAQQVLGAPYAQLINKVLSDRYTPIDQFGYTSTLSLPTDSYALKTGTSDDFRDTWVVGYTPDFVVGAWVGNTDNSPTKNLSGQTGAGEIWSRVMQIMLDTEYNRHSRFSFAALKKVRFADKDSYGLPDDDVARARRLLVDHEPAR